MRRQEILAIRAIWYEGCGSHPREYDSVTIDELQALVDGPCFFARKFLADCFGLDPVLALVNRNYTEGRDADSCEETVDTVISGEKRS